MTIRKYNPTDKATVLHLFHLNTPEYFAQTELADLEKYLVNEREDYFVVETEGQIVGAGGVNYLPSEKTARISWDAIHPRVQGQGIGRILTEYRINHIKNKPAIKTIVVRTSQFAYLFYEKVGFTLASIEKDFWTVGFDLYLMKYEL